MPGFIGAGIAMKLLVPPAAFADHVYDVVVPAGYGLLNALVALGALAGAITSAHARATRLALGDARVLEELADAWPSPPAPSMVVVGARRWCWPGPGA